MFSHSELKELVEHSQDIISPQSHADLCQAIEQIIKLLDMGELRVAEKKNFQWVTHEWVKKALFLYLQMGSNTLISSQFTHFFNKVPAKYAKFDKESFQQQGARIVPPAYVNYGSFIARNVVLMPCYINSGAYIDSGTMVDTWATVGLGAQIGKNVHLSGGVGIGGITESLQTHPTIIEDGCFVGARSEVAEGMIVEEGAVISMGVYLNLNTPIYNRNTGEILYGRVPAGSVVISGYLPSKDGLYNSYAAIIVKQVDAKTKEKISLNELVREDLNTKI